ncbi:MAG: hypothetical protein HY549_09200 [Elusimicrobia bacterium]|nr:hypothetical protein [Elusimicrobiota bacterium]
MENRHFFALGIAGAAVALAAGFGRASSANSALNELVQSSEQKTLPRAPESAPSAASEISPAGFGDDFFGGGRGQDHGDWGGRRGCSAYDRGYEEHWGGHGGWGTRRDSACRSCKKPTGPHGRCYYQCYAEAYECKAEWVPDNGSIPRPYTGERRFSRRDAEDSAMNRCRDDNWRNRDQGRCRHLSCEETRENTDRGDC